MNKKSLMAISVGGALFLSPLIVANASVIKNTMQDQGISKIQTIKESKKNPTRRRLTEKKTSSVRSTKVDTFVSSKEISSLPEPSWHKNAVIKYSFAGVDQDRQDLGIIVKSGGTLRIRQVNPDYNSQLTLRMYGTDRKNEPSALSVGKDWVEVSAGVDLVPFIDTPWESSGENAKIEFEINDDDKQTLETFKSGEDEQKFFENWKSSKESYALLQGKRMQILTPFKDLETAKTAKQNEGISSFLDKYDGIIASDDNDTGLDNSAPWNEKTNARIFVRQDDKGHTGGSTAFSNPDYVATEGSVGLFFSEFWPHLEHEIGHEYQIGVGENGIGGNGGLVTTEITNEVVLGLRYMKDRDYFWDASAGPSNAEKKDIAEPKMYQSLIKDGKKYGDLPDSEKIILMALMFQRAGDKSSIPFYQEARKIIATSGFSTKNQTFSSLLQHVFSDTAKINYTPLLDRLGGSTTRDEEIKILDNNYPAIAMLADVVPESSLENAREILDKKYDVDSNFMMITNDEISSLGLKGDINIDCSDISVSDGETYVLKNGNKIVSETKIQDKQLSFKDVPNGVYQLEKKVGDKTLGNIKYVYVKESENNDSLEKTSTTLDLSQEHLLYEKNEGLTENQIIKESGATTESTNFISSDFDNNITDELGDKIVKITATNPTTGEIITKEVTISVVEPSASLQGTVNFTGDANMEVGKPADIELNLSGLESNTSDVQSINLSHQFNTSDLTLSSVIHQKLPGEDWKELSVDPNSSVNLKVNKISKNENYGIKYNITSKKALTQKAGDQWKVNYTYVNEVDGIKKTYSKSINLTLDINVENSNEGDQSTSVTKQGTITFRTDDKPVNPVDPVDPDEPITPVNPINPYGSELMITYASDLNFGIQSKSETKWNALADDVEDLESGSPTKKIVPIVSVKDSRGTERKGWKLEVTKDDDFKDENGNVLAGAELTFSNLNYANRANSPVASIGNIELSKQASVIATADEKQGAGITSLALGEVKKENESINNANGYSENQTVYKTTGVTLSVLPGTLINTAVYTTNITYELVAGV